MKKNKDNRHRHTIDFVRRIFQEKGVELLEKEYVNNATKMLCKCCVGHIFKIRFNQFRGCPKCNLCKRPQSTLKYSSEDVRDMFKKYGCELLSSYINVNSNLKYRCACGHFSTTFLYAFRKNKRCNKCAKKGANNPSWIKDRQEANSRKMFRTKCHCLVRHSLQATGRKKILKTPKILGYSSEELRKHVVNHPNWEKIKNKCWHIDHIFPIKAFLDHGIEDLKIINCLENLQPISGHDNFCKSAKYNEMEFLKWIEKKL